MGKIMISLDDKIEQLVRKEVDRLFMGHTGGLSIFFDQVLRQYFKTRLQHRKQE